MSAAQCHIGGQINLAGPYVGARVGRPRRAPHCRCRATRAVLPPPLAGPCQPPHLARPCQHGLADDLPPGATTGADPSRRSITAFPKVSGGIAGGGIAPTWPAVQFQRRWEPCRWHLHLRKRAVGGASPQGGGVNHLELARKSQHRLANRSTDGVCPFGGAHRHRRAISFVAPCQTEKASSARVGFCATCQEGIYEPL